MSQFLLEATKRGPAKRKIEKKVQRGNHCPGPS